MHDADTFSYDEWAWGCCQAALLLSFQCCFCAGDNETCQRSTQHAFSPGLTKRISCHVNNGTKVTRPSCLNSCCFIGRGTQRDPPAPPSLSLSLQSLIHCNIVFDFWACASLLWESGLGMTEHKAPRSDFSVLYSTNKVGTRPEYGPAQHQPRHGYMKRFTLTVTDTLPTIHWRLLNKSASQRFQGFF